MKKRLLIVGLILSTSISSWSQTTNLGDPISFKGKIKSTEQVPVRTMPSFDVQAMLDADAINSQDKAVPFRFGYEHTVEYTISNTGLWTTLPSGAKIWRLHVRSSGALSMNIIFNDFKLADGARLHLYNADHSYVQGAYTSKNNNANEMLGTDLIPGEDMIIELFEPANSAVASRLQIGTIVHGYKDINSWTPEKVNESGNCNLDVVCPDGDPWANEINSVARILNGGGLCTGTLVNNTANDGTPYFLTADHCSPASMGGAVFRFNYKSPTCGSQSSGNSQSAVTNDIVNGSIFRASNAASDFGLIELNSVPPVGYGVYYAGWDNTGAAVSTATGVHHPAGDVMKLAFDDDPTTYTSYSGTAVPGNGTHVRVETWERNTTTEGGSSGSALWDQDHRIIGQLHGGGAACGNTQSDWYGAFSVSWDGTSSSTRLRDWLDPSNNTGTIDGFDPNSPSVDNDARIQSIVDPNGVICSSSIDPVVTLKNDGSLTLTSVTINYDIDGGANNTFSWTGSLTSGASEDVTLPTIITAAGAHMINSSTSMPNGVADENVANDANSSAYTAFINGVAVEFEINTDCWGSETDWAVLDGATTLYSGGPYGDVVGGETFTETYCLDPGCYDFEINDVYGDGMFGSQYGSCDVNGSYYIKVANRIIDSIQATDSDFENQEVNNFCIKSIYADVTSNTQLICETNQVQFTGSTLIGTASSYTWVFEGGVADDANISNPEVTYAAAGVYDVTLTVTDGNDTDVFILEDYITVSGAASISGVVTDATVGNNGSINISVTGGQAPYTFAWTNGAGTNEDPTNLAPGDYEVTVTDDAGCVSVADFTVDDLTGISESSIELSLFPNPTLGVLNIKMNEVGATVKVFNAIGQQVINTKTVAETTTIDLSIFQKGMYLVHIETSNGDHVVRKVTLAK